jgi:hypothetical protein
MIFLAVCWVSLMTHHECCVDRPFPYHVTGVGWELSPPPPPQVWALGCLFKLAFWCLTISSPNTVTWTCDWLNWFSLIIIFINFNFHLQTSPGARASSSFLSMVFFFGGLPFALYLFSLELRAVVQLSLLSRCFVRIALYSATCLQSGCLNCCLIGVVVGQSL